MPLLLALALAAAPLEACPDPDPAHAEAAEPGAQPGWSERLAELRFVIKPEPFPHGVSRGRWAWLSLPAREGGRPLVRGKDLAQSALGLLELGRGRLVWSRPGAGRPLIAGPDYVLALSPVGEDDVRVVALSTSGARLFASKTLPLPRSPVAIGSPQLENGALVLQWSAQRGCADGQELRISGTLRVDLGTGDAQVTSRRPGSEPVDAAPEPLESKGADRLFRAEMKGDQLVVCAVRSVLPDHQTCPAEKQGGCELPAGPPGCALWRLSLPAVKEPAPAVR